MKSSLNIHFLIVWRTQSDQTDTLFRFYQSWWPMWPRPFSRLTKGALSWRYHFWDNYWHSKQCPCPSLPSKQAKNYTKSILISHNMTRGRGGSIGRASASRSNGIPWPEVQIPSGAQVKFVSFSESKCCADSSVCPTPVCISTHKNVRTLKIL